jgi:site-specific recombinase XerD
VRHDPATRWKVKNGDERIVHLNEATFNWLTRHMADRTRARSPYLFSNRMGKPLAYGDTWTALDKIFRKIGVEKGNLHMLRHTWATRHAESNTPIAVVKEMGGWRDWKVMRKYMHIGDEALRRAAARVVFSPEGEGPMGPAE